MNFAFFDSNSASIKYAKQSGFTLVEIAIVLVIIGLLLGGIIKGREMIQNTKVKHAVNQAKSLAAAIYAYQDKYGALPGDDPNAKTNLAGGVGGCVADDIENGNGGGTITEYWYAVEHLACANLIKGSYNGVDQHVKSIIGREVLVYYETISGYTGNVIRFSSVPPYIGLGLDKALDDGIYNTGSVRANGDYTALRHVGYFY